MGKIGSIVTDSKLLSDLRRVVYQLTFVDNFRAWETTQTIAANTEVAIPNAFQNGAIPTKWIVSDHRGNGIVVRGDTEWTSDYVFLKNRSATDSVTVTVLFFR
jgi:hypothetical protein